MEVRGHGQVMQTKAFIYILGINFVYYTAATILASTIIKLDYGEVVSLSSKARKAGAHLLKLSTLVWIGSQATKVLRISFAVVSAPAFERIILEASKRLRMDRNKTFGVLVRGILSATVLFYFTAYVLIVCSI